MSKAVKDMLVEDYRERFGDVDDALVISLRGIDANANNAIRSGLRKKDIHVSVVRNKLFTKAFGESKLSGLSPLLTGANALAYGAESVVDVARAIVDLVKDHPDLELKGAILDGEVYAGEDGVTRLSKFPTRDEAIAQDVTLILGPGRKLLGAVKGPGSNLVGIIKAIETKLEDGETISKVG
ncbi:MAG: 50S ribosomal protein L10 [Phycisphaeraceae bacterium]|nr:MAG: 50S ribosomal protein L10 [Phycisphaeraceae bacterium]